MTSNIKNDIEFSIMPPSLALGRRRLEDPRNRDSSSFPLIIWGSHHKTGTYLAQKMFSLLCGKMSWCCVFHVTRDSIMAIQNTLATEPVHVLGHSQWLWFPEEFGRPYRFVHFYRQPFKKIVSGYRYHLEGAEQWTKSLKPYASVCSSSVFNTSLTQQQAGLVVSREDVVAHCRSTQLCEACCRREHETRMGLERAYSLRSPREYSLQCAFLGRVSSTLQESLLQQAPKEGILTEAALDFYETLRMARIVNHTWNDPYSLNVDLDDLTKNFGATTRKILRHLSLGMTSKSLEMTAQEIGFFDLDTSPLYRWSMSNPFVNHVSKQSGESSAELTAVLMAHEGVNELYREVLSLMPADS